MPYALDIGDILTIRNVVKGYFYHHLTQTGSDDCRDVKMELITLYTPIADDPARIVIDDAYFAIKSLTKVLGHFTLISSASTLGVLTSVCLPLSPKFVGYFPLLADMYMSPSGTGPGER